MVRVVGIRFKLAGKVYYFDPADLPITAGNKVIVETVRGVEYGEVVVGPKDVEDDQVVQPLKKVIRVSTERDAQIAIENKRKEKEAFGIAITKIEAHKLEMYLVDVEYTFDGSKIIFYFTAEGRVDFRELVRDLASVFRTRIEMRQIGVRDEAKLLGGIGPCGRILCCTSFLGDFAPVSIRMAKDQNLSLNPSKISGLCGRLMCCLRYEQDTYVAAKKDPTLAPGYVPPAALIDPDAPLLEEMEDDRPIPTIEVRSRTESGFSARIAQAAGVAERSEGRRERPRGAGDRPGGERPSGDRNPGERGGEGRTQSRHEGESHGGRQSGGLSQPGRPKGQPGQGVDPQGGRREGRPDGDRSSNAPARKGGRPQEQSSHREHRHQGEPRTGEPRSQGERRPVEQNPTPGKPLPPKGAPQGQTGQRGQTGAQGQAGPQGQAVGQAGAHAKRRRRRRGPRPEGSERPTPTPNPPQ